MIKILIITLTRARTQDSHSAPQHHGKMISYEMTIILIICNLVLTFEKNHNF